MSELTNNLNELRNTNPGSYEITGIFLKHLPESAKILLFDFKFIWQHKSMSILSKSIISETPPST